MKKPIIQLYDNFNPPKKFEHSDFDLEVLSPLHNKMDFEAWNSSIEDLKGIFGPRNNWPEEVSSLEKNLKDLNNHLKEFKEKEAFTYTILNPQKDLCIGCLYIRPTNSKQHDCRVDFWFRNSHKNLEPNFYSWLNNWLVTDWGFENIAYPGRNMEWEEYYEVNR